MTTPRGGRLALLIVTVSTAGIAACGAYGEERPAAPSSESDLAEKEASTSASTPAPAPKASSPAATPCDITKPFTITSLASAGASETGARWDRAKTRLVFARDGGTLAIGKSLLDATTSAFASLQTGNVQLSYPSLSENGLVLHYASTEFVDGTERSDIWIATRTRADLAFANAKKVDVAATDASEYAPWMTTNGNALYWARWNQLDARWQLMRWAPNSGAAAQEVYTDASALLSNPVVTGDEMTMYFSFQQGATSDVYVATRSSLSERFTNAKRIDSVSTTTLHEMPTWVSDDHCDMLYEVIDATFVAKDVIHATRAAGP